MKNEHIPFFEVNGKRYEIKRNRYLQAEFDKLKNEVQMSDEEQIAYTKESNFESSLEKIIARKEELYDKYLQTFDKEDEELYKKACLAYDKFIEENGKGESVVGKQRKKMLDIGEKIIIKSLQLNDKGETIRSEDEANDIWCGFVEDVGQFVIVQFVAFTLNYILGSDEDIDNPFLTQAKAKAEQRENMKKGLKVVK